MARLLCEERCLRPLDGEGNFQEDPATVEVWEDFQRRVARDIGGRNGHVQVGD